MFRVNTNQKPDGSPHNRFMRLGGTASVVLMALALVGCESYQKDHFTVGSVPSDYRTKHPILVSNAEDFEDLIVTPDMARLSQRQRGVVVAFLSRFRKSGAPSVRIVLPAGSHNEAAARRVAHDIVELMKQKRIKRQQISMSRYHAANHGDSATIRLSFQSTVAEVTKPCGQWPDDLVNNTENRNYENFGCATQNNLAEMISDPQDLISPRGQSEIDAERRDNVIDEWRTNGTPSLPSLL